MSHGLCHWHRENLYWKELQRILEVFLTRMGLKDVESMETTFQAIPGIGERVMNGVFSLRGTNNHNQWPFHVPKLWSPFNKQTDITKLSLPVSPPSSFVLPVSCTGLADPRRPLWKNIVSQKWDVVNNKRPPRKKKT